MREKLFTLTLALIITSSLASTYIKVSTDQKTKELFYIQCENKTNVCNTITYIAYKDTFACDLTEIPNNSCRIKKWK